jgi:hypothetical protein
LESRRQTRPQATFSFSSLQCEVFSPDIQNEIVDIAGEEVLEVILSKARSAKWFSIMADECTDVANLEQMAVCIRFVDANNIVNEEFIGFIPLDKVAAASINTALLKKMEVCKLDLRGQCELKNCSPVQNTTTVGPMP